ncbi:beta strand repeat-containing protein [Aliiroseovarius marinus]|uniref:beta strand repeat-containing protein n=1 Tax=Aliiroseovarius marinus TaxID=2500159 RepID=UPI00105D1E26|nr:hypothetical protein [Aliiroseovarius marinus]
MTFQIKHIISNTKRTAALLAGSTAIILSGAQLAQAEIFIIDTAVNATNGGATLDGDDTIKVTKSGSITTAGAGLFATGDANTLINNGSIASGGDGMRATGDDNVIVNNGAITTTSISAEGISSDDRNTVRNTGSIRTVGSSAEGIFLDNDNIVDNSGLIRTTGSSSEGIDVDNFNTITNSGRVITLGSSSEGINAEDFSTVVNSGLVRTAGTGSDGIEVDDNGAVENTGSVETSGAGADGINADDNGRVVNSGTVTTTGTFADGIETDLAGDITNSGSVRTAGFGASAIRASGVDSVILNSGVLAAEGAASRGIWALADDASITNSGTISSAQDLSILMQGSNAELTLLEGSVLVGNVGFSQAGTATLNFGAGLSAVVKMDSGVPATITAASGVFAIVGGDTVVTADVSDFAAQDVMVADFGRLIADSIPASNADVQVARGALSFGKPTWAKVFGSVHSGPGGTDIVGFRGYTGGVIVGRDGDGAMGYFGGFGLQHSGSRDSDAFDINTKSLFGGIYGTLGGGDYSLALGVMRNDSTRQVANNTVATGVEEVTARYTSVFIAPTYTLNGVIGGGNNSLRLRYMGVWNAAHSFDFGQADLDVDARMSHVVEARFEMRTPLAGSDFLRYGVDAVYQDGQVIDVTLGGAPFAVSSGADGWSGRVFAGLEAGAGRIELSYDTEDRFSATAGWSINF